MTHKLPAPAHLDYAFKRVRLVPETGDLHESLGGMHLHRSVIALAMDKHPSASELVDTVLHECAHLIYEMAELEEGDTEERVVSVMGHGLTELFKRNPHLLDWLKEQLAEE